MANHEEKPAATGDASPTLHESPEPKEMSVKEYCTTRLSSLKPPMNKVENPIKLLRMLNARQWSFFALAFAAWSWDAFDFFTVSLTVTDLAEQFGKKNTEITWGITLVCYPSITDTCV